MVYFSCANRVAPTGGTKDVMPPKILSSQPNTFSTRFNQKEIKIDFDEYIQLVELNKQLIISPLIDPIPEITVKKKSLLIELKKPLKENTTYTFNFGSAIADIHEKNIFENFQFVFSTGDYLDSLSISGKAAFAENLKTEKGILVMLYNETNDSIPYKKLPDYFAKTDESGNFKINNIGSGTYKIFALKDKNNNYLFDQPDEAIAFLDSPILVTDSTKADLKLFINPADKVRLKNTSVEETGKLKIIFNSRTEDLKIKTIGTEKNPWQLEEYSPNRDTLTLWMTDTTKDTLKLAFLQNDQPFDTATFVLKRKSTVKGKIAKKFSFNSSISNGTVDAGKDLILNFTHPVSNVNERNVIFKKDSIISTGITFSFSDSIKRTLVAKYPWKENENYELTFLPGALKDVFNSENDTAKIYFRLKAAAEYGSVLLKLKTDTSNTNYIVQIVNDKDEVIREKNTASSSDLLFDLLNPASYRFRIIYDENKNRWWDTGNYLKHIQPEKIIYYKEKINIRANWDLEQEWQLNQQPSANNGQFKK